MTNQRNRKTFTNLEDSDCTQNWFKILKWKLNFKNRSKWPTKVDSKHTEPNLKNTFNKGIKATFINHATVLVQMDGFNILTDPVWSQRVSPLSWAGPKRVQDPGVKFDKIPKVDLILVSHNHYDHMDVKTLEKFAKRDQPKIITGLNNISYLKTESQKLATELDWDQTLTFKSLKITFLPARHWSKRTFFDTNKSLWGAFAVEGSQKFYFAGDSGYGKHFKLAGEKFLNFDLALIPIGAYSPRWCLQTHHMDPVDAVKAHRDLNSKHSMGIHHSTFQLTDEPIHEPRELLEEAKKKMALKTPFVSLNNGESIIVSNNLNLLESDL